MGLILGRFRKKKTTFEQLEKIDADIRSIEKFRLNTELAQRRIVGQFILVSAGIYVIVAVVFYFYFFPATFYDQIFYITPLLLVPFIIWGVKRLLTWYYRRKILLNDSKLSNLRVEKKKLLDHVMDTETYKVAKTILEKFAPDQIRKSPPSFEITPYKPSLTNPTTSILSTPATVRNRAIPPKPGSTLTGVPKTPAASTNLVAIPASRMLQTPGPSSAIRGANGQQNIHTLSVKGLQSQTQPSLPLPREIIPRDRSILDKMVEYLVGDGPGNRFALICKSCHGHNGMALPEEYEYFAFRCCYCYNFNPARKLRPQAPKLEIDAPTSSPERLRRNSTRSTSSSERNSSTDTESDDKDMQLANPFPMGKIEIPIKTEEEKKKD